MDEPRPPAAPPGTPPNLGTQRKVGFDSLRGIAALSVFFAHVAVFLTAVAGERLEPYLTRLDFGIAIFLLLSSFLLYRPFVEARYTRARPPAVVPYGLRRALRIVPVYWVSLPIVALMLSRHDVFTAEGIVRYFGFLQVYDSETIDGGIGQAWTICVEVTFYAMLPVAAFLLRRVPFRTTRGFVLTELGFLAGLFAFAVAWKLRFAEPALPAGLGNLDPMAFVLPASVDAFAVGMALAVVSVVLAHRERQPAVVRLIDRAPWAPIVLAAFAYWASGLGGGGLAVDSKPLWVLHQELNVLVALSLFLPVVFGDQSRGLIRRLYSSRWLIWMGGISYGFFLWHLAILEKLRDLGWLEGSPGPVAFTAVALAGSILMGAVTYYGLGRYAIRLGSRIPREGFRARRGGQGGEPAVAVAEGQRPSAA